MAVLPARNILPARLHVACPSFHCLHSSPTPWSSLSMPSTHRPPGTHLQWSKLGLLLDAVKQNTHHRELGASQHGGVRKDLQGLGLFLSRSIMVIEWPCLAVMFCEIVYIQQENATAWLWVPGQNLDARDCFLCIIIDSLLHRTEMGGEGSRY